MRGESSHVRRSCREFKQQRKLFQPKILELIYSSNSHVTHTQCFFPLAMVTPKPQCLVFHWPQFTPMNCPFFIGYCFTPTYSVFSENHSGDFLHSQMYLSKHPLCSITSAGQSDISVLTLLILCMYVNNTRWFNTSVGHGDILQ